jgi:hypothetical protein
MNGHVRAEYEPIVILISDATFADDRWTIEGEAPPGTAQLVITTTEGEGVKLAPDAGRWSMALSTDRANVNALPNAGRWSVTLSPMRHPHSRFRKPYDAQVIALRADGSVIAIDSMETDPGVTRRIRFRRRLLRVSGYRFPRRARGMTAYGPGKPK